MTPQNVSMMVSGNMVSVGWDGSTDGLRYHVWLELQPGAESRQAAGRTHGVPVVPYRVRPDRVDGKVVIYKNPPLGVEYARAGYFPTRRLDAAAKGNAPMVREALQQAEALGLYDSALDQLDRDEADRQAKQLRGQSDALAAALRDFRPTLDQDHPWQELLATLQVDGTVEDRAALFRAIRRVSVADQ